MLLQKIKIPRKIKGLFRKFSKQSGATLLVCLFIISSALPVIAKNSTPTPTVQIQASNEKRINRAIQLYRAGKYPEAVTAWKRIAKLFGNERDKLNQAMALSNLSLSYQKLQQWQEAEKAIKDGIKILETQPPSKEQQKILAASLDVQGLLQRETGKSSDALQSWQQSTKIYSQLKDSKKVAQSQVNQSQAMQDLGLHPRACKTALSVLNSYLQFESCEEISKLKTNEELEKLIKEAKTDDKLQKLKELKKETIDAKLKSVTTSTTPYTTALALRSLGQSLRLIGGLKQSQKVLETSLQIFEQINNTPETIATYVSLGNTFKTLADSEQVRDIRENYESQALTAYNQVIQLSPPSIIRQQAQSNALSLFLRRKEISPENVSTIENLWTSLQSQLNNLPPSHSGVYLQINLAHSLIKLLDDNNPDLKVISQLPTFEQTDKILIRAINQAQLIGDKRAEAYGWGYRGELYELNGNQQNLPQAEKFTKQSLAIISSLDAPEVSYPFFWQLGRIRKEQGDIKDAISAYTKAYNALQILRGDLVAVNPELQFSFRDTVEPIYRQLVQLDLTYADTLNQAKNKAAKNQDKEITDLLIQARDVIESLQLSALNNFFREVCADEQPQEIDAIDKKAAVIYPIILTDEKTKQEKLDILLSLPNQSQQSGQSKKAKKTKQEPIIQLYSQDVTGEKFQATVDNLRRSLLNAESDETGFLPVYQELYNWLIKPLEAQLATADIETLVFVLDGELRNIPMAVLHDGNKYLIEKYAIALAPGLRLVNPKTFSDVDFNVLTAGLSKTRPDLDIHRGFPDLLNVDKELKTIKDLGLAKQPLLNDKFTSQSLEQVIANSRPPIVHLATHGQFSSKEENTFILSWDKRIDVKELNTLLQDKTLIPPKPIELLVLSACETASGDNRATLGLAGVAVRAGTRSTVATLWSVVDNSTAKLMDEFYQQLKTAKKEKKNKAQALQKAQLALINGKEKEFRHPHFWAPFVMVGNWQ